MQIFIKHRDTWERVVVPLKVTTSSSDEAAKCKKRWKRLKQQYDIIRQEIIRKFGTDDDWGKIFAMLWT